MANAMVDAMHDDSVYRRVEVITGRRRRRDWPDEEKSRIVGETLGANVNISAVARRNGVSRGLLTVWRKQARALACESQPGALFAAVRVENEVTHRDCSDVPAPGPAAAKTVAKGASAIRIDIGGATVRVPRGVDRATLDAVISALRGTR
jgi:transposase